MQDFVNNNSNSLQTCAAIPQFLTFQHYLGLALLINMSRTVTKTVLSKWQDEGVGARVRRSVGRPEVRECEYILKNIYLKYSVENNGKRRASGLQNSGEKGLKNSFLPTRVQFELRIMVRSRLQIV